MAAMRIRTGDTVQVVSGKDRGKTGEVLRVDPERRRVYVQGLNMIKRHVPQQQVPGASGEQTIGGVIEMEGPIQVSNVALLDPEDGKPTRVGVIREDGERIRVAKRSGKRID